MTLTEGDATLTHGSGMVLLRLAHGLRDRTASACHEQDLGTPGKSSGMH